MTQTKNLCAQIPIALHTQVCEAREQSGLTTAEYITNLLIEYFGQSGPGRSDGMAWTALRTQDIKRRTP